MGWSDNTRHNYAKNVRYSELRDSKGQEKVRRSQWGRMVKGTYVTLPTIKISLIN